MLLQEPTQIRRTEARAVRIDEQYIRSPVPQIRERLFGEEEVLDMKLSPHCRYARDKRPYRGALAQGENPKLQSFRGQCAILESLFSSNWAFPCAPLHPRRRIVRSPSLRCGQGLEVEISGLSVRFNTDRPARLL